MLQNSKSRYWAICYDIMLSWIHFLNKIYKKEFPLYIPLIFQIRMEPSLEAVIIFSESGVKHKQVTALWKWVMTINVVYIKNIKYSQLKLQSQRSPSIFFKQARHGIENWKTAKISDCPKKPSISSKNVLWWLMNI